MALLRLIRHFPINRPPTQLLSTSPSSCDTRRSSCRFGQRTRESEEVCVGCPPFRLSLSLIPPPPPPACTRPAIGFLFPVGRTRKFFSPTIHVPALSTSAPRARFACAPLIPQRSLSSHLSLLQLPRWLQPLLPQRLLSIHRQAGAHGQRPRSERIPHNAEPETMTPELFIAAVNMSRSIASDLSISHARHPQPARRAGTVSCGYTSLEVNWRHWH